MDTGTAPAASSLRAPVPRRTPAAPPPPDSEVKPEMDPLPDAPYSDPNAWRIDPDVTEGALAMVVKDGTAPLFRLPRFDGEFYLRPTGRLAGFSLSLELPDGRSPSRFRGRRAPTLRWESTDLRTPDGGADGGPGGGAEERGDRDGGPDEAGDRPDDARNRLEGRGLLTLGRRETWAAVTGVCAPVPCAHTGRPYLKIVLETVFPSLALWWPREARRRLRPAVLTLFGDIRPAWTGPCPPPGHGQVRP